MPEQAIYYQCWHCGLRIGAAEYRTARLQLCPGLTGRKCGVSLRNANRWRWEPITGATVTIGALRLVAGPDGIFREEGTPK